MFPLEAVEDVKGFGPNNPVFLVDAGDDDEADDDCPIVPKIE